MGQWALLEHSPAFCKKWGPLEKRAGGVYLFWAALQTPILHPLYSADHSYTYWLSVVKKMKTHTLFKQRSNALELWWLYSWKFNPAKARFTLNTQGPVRKMAYIILNFIPKLLFDETHQVVPIFLDFVIALCYWNHNTLFSKEGMITTCQELD